MGSRKYAVASVVIILTAIVLHSSVFVVDLPHDALVLQFGKVVAVKREPGLYIKLPFIQSVKYYDKRLKEWDGEPNDLLTVDKENIEVNTFARWRIVDPLRFYEKQQTEAQAQGTLDGIIESSVKNVISAQPLMEVLRTTQRRLRYSSEELENAEAAKAIVVQAGRDAIVEKILEQAARKAREEYGFAIEGVAIRHLNYVRAVVPKIFERMKSERIRIASRYESEGREREATILGETKKELDTIESQGTREATILEGAADAEVLTIYAEAYEQDPEFYSFMRSLEILPEVLGGKTRIVIGTDSPLFRLLKTYEKEE
jgi:membrane protease subunit HflC